MEISIRGMGRKHEILSKKPFAVTVGEIAYIFLSLAAV